MYIYIRDANREIPKLEKPGFSGFTNPESLDFLKLAPGFSGLWIHAALTCMLNEMRASNCSLF